MPKRKNTTSPDHGKKGKPGKKSVPHLTGFESIYGTALLRIAYLWTYDDGNDGDWPPPRHVITSPDGEWTMVFQPKKNADDSDKATLIFQRTDGDVITKWKKEVKTVETLLMTSFNHLLTLTGGKWFSDVSDLTNVNDVLHILKPLEMASNKKSLRLTFKYAGNCAHHSWYPRALAERLGVVDQIDPIVTMPYHHLVKCDLSSNSDTNDETILELVEQCVCGL